MLCWQFQFIYWFTDLFTLLTYPTDTECSSSVGDRNTNILPCYAIAFHLHWLPISYRIKFKILLLTFKCLYGQAPNYLIDLITIKKQSRYSLRSNESIFLELQGIKTRPTLGDRAFQSAAPYLWNAYLRQFAKWKHWTLLRLLLKLICWLLL